ncbi:RNA-directed DNA polymerase, eukaryota, reverse transcriptase zinc-binding domain protein [Tanacetum coccineum]|uniref:RNA-directed DNA polymerase, eukaryota, reverse transcriptase zinc-binding domain protein n=1 Tax=Tanacetum coccineum TaxID=301880 RepID=A0ABQ5I5Y8_9ASTR
MAKDKDGRKENIKHSVEKVNGGMNTKLFSTFQNSFAHAVIGKNHMEGVENDMSPVVVLDDECLVEKDISKSLFGRVKEFASLANLKVAICNEGFEELKISYIGESWVKLDFGSVESIKKFQEKVSIGSWFSCIKQADMDFVIEGRVAWVEIEGIPFKLWSNNTFKRIASRWGVLIDTDAQEETCYHSKRLCVHTKSGRSILENFKIVYRGKVYWIRASETTGWVPDFADEEDEEDQEENLSNDGGLDNDVSGINDGESEMNEVPETFFEEEGVKKIVAENGEDSVEVTMKDAEIQNNGEDNVVRSIKNHSTDPFGLYAILNKKKGASHNVEKAKFESSYPLGYLPNEDGFSKVVTPNDVEELSGQNIEQEEGECLANQAKKDWVKKICVSNKVNFMSIQETKMEIIDLWDIKRCWGNFSFDYAYSEAVGQSGGILCVWDDNMFQKLNRTVSDYFVMIRGVWVPSGKNLLVISVYAPQELRDKKLLWDYLRTQICNWEGDVITMGDFNEVRTSSERFGSIFNKIGAKFFNEFIANACLVEIPLGGCSYTWCHKSANKMSKLDRFLISDSLLSRSPGISSVSLDRYLSDHRPILMQESYQDYGPTPFKFYHHWFECHGFDKFVEESWKEISILDSNDYVSFMKKLRIMKGKIKSWIKSYKECANGQINILKSELHNLDSVFDRGCGVSTDVQRRQEIVYKIQDLEKIEIMEMAQKAKIKWAVEGDENSKYYHGVINKKRSKLAIRGVLVDGTWIDSPPLVKKAFFDHFKSQFEQPCSSDVLLDRDFTNKVSLAQHGIIPNGGNSSFITLIPKIPNANMVKDFRPISLIGSVYKIIAKILENRLVTVLEDIVSESQYAFVKDRQILDGPFILNELVQWWDFIDIILKKFGFGEKWCNWIGGCLRTSRGSVLVNGSPTPEFQFCKDAGLFSGIRLDNSTSITHLFYADDAIFIGQWNCSNIDIITRVLDIFHKASGLRINMTKSKLLGVSVDQDIVEQAVSKISCTVLKMPFNYLGSKVGSLMSRTMSWNEVLERMVTRLSRWKIKTISIGRRLTLLKSVLGSTPLYHMSMFRVPKKVIQLMETIRSRFFNGADSTIRKHSWVSWKKTMASKDTGGLGVASLFALNRALMFKWIWRFITQKKSLWARVIKAIHGPDGKIGKKVNASYPSTWLSIIHEMGVMQFKGIDILNYIKQKCGDGSSTSFWKDTLRGEIAFKELFPRLYMLENMKEGTVAEKLAHEDLEWSFRRKSRSGSEMQQLDSLKEKIAGVILSNSRDRWTWSLEESGEFSISSLRKAIDLIHLPQSGMKTRWIKEVPIKINILAWKVSNDYLPTRINLSRRGMDIESILCPMCNSMAESSSHLFFLCDFSQQIASKIFRWWELDYQEIKSYEEWVSWMANIRLTCNSKKVLEGIHSKLDCCVAFFWVAGDIRRPS